MSRHHPDCLATFGCLECTYDIIDSANLLHSSNFGSSYFAVMTIKPNQIGHARTVGVRSGGLIRVEC